MNQCDGCMKGNQADDQGFHRDANGMPYMMCERSLYSEGTPNYVVHIQDWNGSRKIECNTEDETWTAISSMAFGGLYQVESPIGKSIADFVPF